ncbi:MAG: PilZ domain-containing protein [Myxococcales bacterium]|nr:PilZ domain-containing protein [Myxococcales bacterium]
MKRSGGAHGRTTSPKVGSDLELIDPHTGDEVTRAELIRLNAGGDGLLRVDVDNLELEIGTQIEIVFGNPGDARYSVPAAVEKRHGRTLSLRPIAPWNRVQQRAYFRLPTPGLTGTVVALGHESGEELDRTSRFETRILDLSAGGAAICSPFRLRVESAVALDLRLSAHESTTMQGEVRRVWTTPRNEPRAGIRFVDIDDELRQRLTRWIFEAQARRARGAG